MKGTHGFLTLGLLLLGALSALGQSEATGSVEGEIVLEGIAQVELEAVVTCSARSDYEAVVPLEGGRFEVTDVPLGEIDVKVYSERGELVAEGKATLEATGDSVTVELEAVP